MEVARHIDFNHNPRATTAEVHPEDCGAKSRLPIHALFEQPSL
jgi:hypothetical protein